MIEYEIDEQKIEEMYPGVLDILLIDRTTRKNIIFASENYKKHGFGPGEKDFIKKDMILRKRGSVIKPRINKSVSEQKERSKDMAEVFTPSWVCNKQNNLIDEEWFGYKNPFNKEIGEEWESNNKVEFRDKNWKEYVDLERLEITCGEAPYLTSRYDVVTGNYIDPFNRIGLLDRKLRVISENIKDKSEWIKYTLIAFQRIYGFDFQGDNVFLSRSNLLFTFIDFYYYQFSELPTLEEITEIATIISWNIWQMDGIKYVLPLSCHEETVIQLRLFDDFFNDADEEPYKCRGCKSGNIYQHNGVYSKIMDWRTNKKIKFIDLLR